MKNHKVRPEFITELVGKTLTSFKTWQVGINHLPTNIKAEYMHYMSDMLDDLINTAYPLEQHKPDIPESEADEVATTLNKGREARAKAMKEFISPMDSSTHSSMLKQMFEDKDKMAELDRQLEAVARIARNTRPPKSPMDINIELINKMFGGDK